MKYLLLLRVWSEWVLVLSISGSFCPPQTKAKFTICFHNTPSTHIQRWFLEYQEGWLLIHHFVPLTFWTMEASPGASKCFWLKRWPSVSIRQRWQETKIGRVCISKKIKSNNTVKVPGEQGQRLPKWQKWKVVYFFKLLSYCSITVVCIFPHHSPQSQPIPLPSLASTRPLGFVLCPL